ncbi:MAG: hypothetical protein JWR21_3096 [Herminiimonas sp.]|nr:hypothetical protein [Herminiimonas sp.]
MWHGSGGWTSSAFAESGVPVEAVFAAPVFQKHRLPRPFCKLMSSGQYQESMVYTRKMLCGAWTRCLRYEVETEANAQHEPPKKNRRRTGGFEYYDPVGLVVCRIDIIAARFLDEQHADHEGDQGDDDRVPEAVVNVTLVGDQCKGRGRQQAAEPAIADVVRQ